MIFGVPCYKLVILHDRKGGGGIIPSCCVIEEIIICRDFISEIMEGT